MPSDLLLLFFKESRFNHNLLFKESRFNRLLWFLDCQDPYAVVVLLQNDIVIADLTSPR